MVVEVTTMMMMMIDDWRNGVDLLVVDLKNTSVHYVGPKFGYHVFAFDIVLVDFYGTSNQCFQYVSQSKG